MDLLIDTGLITGLILAASLAFSQPPWCVSPGGGASGSGGGMSGCSTRSTPSKSAAGGGSDGCY